MKISKLFLSLFGLGTDVITVAAGTAGLAGNVGADLITFLSARLLEVAELNTVLDQFGEKVPLPSNSSKTIRFLNEAYLKFCDMLEYPKASVPSKEQYRRYYNGQSAGNLQMGQISWPSYGRWSFFNDSIQFFQAQSEWFHSGTSHDRSYKSGCQFDSIGSRLVR